MVPNIEMVPNTEVEAAIAALRGQINASFAVLLAVPLPHEDSVFAPSYDSVAKANENLDEAIAGLLALGISVTRDELWRIADTREQLRKTI